MQAHGNAAPGRLQTSAGELLDANINRSPTAYLANPAAERALYAHDTDKDMTLLKVLDVEGRCVASCLKCRCPYLSSMCVCECAVVSVQTSRHITFTFYLCSNMKGYLCTACCLHCMLYFVKCRDTG